MCRYLRSHLTYSRVRHVAIIIIIISIITVYRNLETIALGWLAAEPNVRVMFHTYRSDGLKSGWMNRQTAL